MELVVQIGILLVLLGILTAIKFGFTQVVRALEGVEAHLRERGAP
jgi:hypothetical protein